MTPPLLFVCGCAMRAVLRMAFIAIICCHTNTEPIIEGQRSRSKARGMEIRWLGSIIMIQMTSCSSLSFRALFRRHPTRIRQEAHLFMSKSATENNDESLDEMLEEVEALLTEDSGTSNATQGANSIGWRSIDWDLISESDAVTPTQTDALALSPRNELISSSKLPSPVEKVFVKGRSVYIKRDDLLRLENSGVSGNKARKFYSLNQISPGLFPSCVVSYGGPQSNAMVALAAIVHSKNDIRNSTSTAFSEESATDGDNTTTNATLPSKRFVFYTKTLPRFLRNQPSGNLFRAQSLGMELVELSNEKYKIMFGGESGGRSEPPASLDPPIPGDSLWVPQGGACGVAVRGGQLLAQEIVSFWLNEGRGRPLSVCVPGGTCTTALLLHREILACLSQPGKESLDIQVVVIPCVGDDKYARRQMMALNLETGGSGDENELPTVLMPFPDTNSYFGQRVTDKPSYFTFGEPDTGILDTFRMMREECDVNLDLLYGAPSWNVMLRHWRTTLPADALTSFDKNNPLAEREIMYVHSGGLEGVASQLTRYRYKGLMELEDIQYPTRR